MPRRHIGSQQQHQQHGRRQRRHYSSSMSLTPHLRPRICLLQTHPATHSQVHGLSMQQHKAAARLRGSLACAALQMSGDLQAAQQHPDSPRT